MGQITRIDRQDFLSEFWPALYKSGHHVLLCGATQRSGKSTIGYQLLDAVPDYVASKQAWCMKPRDKTVAAATERLGFKETADWPPSKLPWQGYPRGYTVWPKHSFDPAEDNERLNGVFKRAMLHAYRKGDTIIFLDEVFGVAELGLQNELSAVLSRGAGMGCAAWMSVQRGSGTQQVSLPGFIWSQPYHYFLAHSSNKLDRQKYADMNGDLDPAFIENTVLNLRQYEFLYTNAEGNAAIISA
jgi:hypothetical protein